MSYIQRSPLSDQSPTLTPTIEPRLKSVLGILDSSTTCAPLTNDKLSDTPPGVMYQGSDYGVAATGLSLATNILATVLVAYRFWDYRNVLRKYVVVGSQVMRLEKALAMVLESGVIYCGIWVRILDSIVSRPIRLACTLPAPYWCMSPSLALSSFYTCSPNPVMLTICLHVSCTTDSGDCLAGRRELEQTCQRLPSTPPSYFLRGLRHFH